VKGAGFDLLTPCKIIIDAVIGVPVFSQKTPETPGKTDKNGTFIATEPNRTEPNRTEPNFY